MAGILLGVVALAVGVYYAVTGGDGGASGLDQRSYKKGYHAFSDAWLPPSDEDRATDEARCEELWGAFPVYDIGGLKKDAWVDGCADYVEGKDSRF